jgi:predicted PhzF superfamily epimerase YddE/YHI9
MVKLRSIELADQQLRLRVPADWVETKEEDGGTAFYDEKQDQGTLRVKVMTFTTEDDLSGHSALGELGAIEAEPDQTLEALPNGNAVRFHRETADGSGARTSFFVWLLASIDPPHRMRLAVFSFTARGEAGSVVQALAAEVRAATFSHQVS